MQRNKPKQKSNQRTLTTVKAVKPYSISRRLVLSLVITVILISTITVTPSYLIMISGEHKDLLKMAEEFQAYLVGGLELPLWNYDHATAREIGKTFSQNKLIVKLDIKNHSGITIYSMEKEHHSDILNCSDKIYHDGKYLGEFEFALTKQQIEQTGSKMLFSYLIAIIFILLSLSLVTGVLIQKLLKKPLNDLNGIIRCYAAGKYDLENAELPYLEFQSFGKVLAQMGETINDQMMGLQKAEQKYRNIFENAVEGIFQATPEGRLIDANRSMSTILGYDNPNELIKNITDNEQQLYYDPLDRDELIGQFDHRDTVSGFESRIVKKDKSIIWISLNARVVRDTQGKLNYLEGFFTDITERKQAEKDNAWNLAVNQALSSLYIPLVTAGTDIEKIANIVLGKCRQLTGSPHGFVAEIDPANGDLIAHTNTKMLQTECKIAEEELRKARFPQRADGLYNGLWGYALNTKEPFYTDVPVKHPASVGVPEGHMEIERFLSVPVLLAGELVGLIALSNSTRAYTDQDLDAVNRMAEFYALAIQHKRAEEQILNLNQELEQRVLERTTQLETANKELEAFAYSVSHDLRAPLRGIEGFGQILLDEYQDRMDEQGKNYLQRVRSAAQHMAQLIDDMLNLSRVGRIDMINQQVNLSDIAREITEDLYKTDPERQVAFVIPKDIKAQGDGQLLRIVLDNLIRNAWKFTSKHPKARIEFGLQQEKETPVYFIRDDGAGFDMKYIDKIFGTFQRLHTANEFAGTGVGLATVQRIIHRHGGKIWAQGEVEKGAVFYFTIKKGAL